MKLFIEFLVLNYLFILVVTAICNYISGVAKAIKDNDFQKVKAIEGFKDLFLLAVGYLTMAAFAFSVKDVTFENMQIFTALFAFLTILIIAYKGNSLAMNFILLAKIPVPKVMITIDEKVKSMFEESKPLPIFGLNDEEAETAMKDSEVI
ncbi:MAG: phage holin family protein [Candidatus Dehalobacter alkaniphilus]